MVCYKTHHGVLSYTPFHKHTFEKMCFGNTPLNVTIRVCYLTHHATDVLWKDVFGEHTFYQKHTFGQKDVFQNTPFDNNTPFKNTPFEKHTFEITHL